MEQQTGSQPSQESPAGPQEPQGRELPAERGARLLKTWDGRSQLKRAEWLDGLDLDETEALSLELGRRALEKLGRGEAAG